MKVLHLTPTYFDPASIIGGGERYAFELARSMAECVDTTLVSFGRRRERMVSGRLKVEIYPARHWIGGVKANPLSFGFVPRLGRFDLIHCHQYRTVVTNLAILRGRIFRQPVFVSDLGGGGGFDLSYHMELGRWVNGYLMISDFAAQSYTQYAGHCMVRTVYGGVDTARFRPSEKARERKVLYVGRILALKGINYLIEAVDARDHLVVLGRPYDPDYYQLLLELSKGKRVNFITDADDERLVHEYQTASVLVLPTVERDVYGNEVGTGGEIFGLVLVEAMACGTPVICTRTGGMPEVVREGETGFIVEPGSPQALRERIHWLLDHPAESRAMGERGRERVLRDFTWRAVSDRCLSAYREVLSRNGHRWSSSRCAY